jgi:hypothetical protein
MLDGHRLVADKRRLDADRQLRRDLRYGMFDVAPESEHVAALTHGDGEPNTLLPVDAEHRLRRVGGPACDLCDVARANHPAVLLGRL